MLLCVYLVYVYITLWFETLYSYYERSSLLEKIGKNNKMKREGEIKNTMAQKEQTIFYFIV